MLGFMAMDYFRQSPMLAFPVLALAIFMLVFCLVSLRAVLTKKTRFEQISRLPLESVDERARGDVP
jgi:hypothetical protein